MVVACLPISTFRRFRLTQQKFEGLPPAVHRRNACKSPDLALPSNNHSCLTVTEQPGKHKLLYIVALVALWLVAANLEHTMGGARGPFDTGQQWGFKKHLERPNRPYPWVLRGDTMKKPWEANRGETKGGATRPTTPLASQWLEFPLPAPAGLLCSGVPKVPGIGDLVRSRLLLLISISPSLLDRWRPALGFGLIHGR